MKGLIVVWVLALILVTSVVSAQQPVKIGFLYIMSGRVAQFGQVAKQGAEVAIDEINANGGINGHPVEPIFGDTKGDPEVALKLARKLVTQDGVDVLIGIISSKVAAATAPEMMELKTPLIVTTALTPVITGSKCNRYTFRITYNLDANLKTAALLASRLKVRKWTTVGPDYSLGHLSWSLFQKYLRQLRSDVAFVPNSEVVFAPLKTSDWAPLAQKVKQSDADGVLISLWGGNFIDFMRQGAKFGLFDGKREYLASVVSLAAILGLRTEMPPGIWITPAYFFQISSDAANKRFVEGYVKRFKSPPPYQAQFAYSGVLAYAEAAKVAGTTEKEAIVKALEGLTVDLPVGKVTIRPQDHQAVFDGYCGRTSSKVSLTDRRKPYRGLESIMRFPSDQIFQPPEQTGCRMGQ